jgi:hypothetical protein
MGLLGSDKFFTKQMLEDLGFPAGAIEILFQNTSLSGHFGEPLVERHLVEDLLLTLGDEERGES